MNRTSEPTQAKSQLELIQQWRSTLECLKGDVGFPACMANVTGEEKSKLDSVIEAFSYLEQKNTLLDENEDFLFSESGFIKYKALHMLVFDYLSKLTKTTNSDEKSTFYFVSRKKHIAQQKRSSNGTHSLIHFLLTLVALFILGSASLMMVVKTQNNLIVILILFWLCFLHFKTALRLVKPFKKSPISPFKFRVSLLGIHSLNTLLKVSLLCLVPIALTANFKPYWVDDVIIISLSILCLFHYKANNLVDETPITSAAKESANV